MNRFLWCSALLALSILRACVASADTRPNILFCISDDQSYAHTGANGDPVVKTPAFDRIAREGIRFTHAFCDAPSCGPSRSAILTGQPIWRLAEAGNIHSTLPARFATYTEMLVESGYVVGYTGKGWGPGRLEPGGRTQNPAGLEFANHRLKQPILHMSNKDYARNFETFLDQRPDGKPFCFWLGTHEPHRDYKPGSGAASRKDPIQVIVPACLPDNDVVRQDILDYYVEIEHYDHVVDRALALLEKAGETNDTIVVVTSDHGMPFPRAKATLYDTGTRVPLAIRWPARITSPGRVSHEFVSLSDMAPTFLEAADLKPHPDMTAHSLMSVFTMSEAIPKSHVRDRAFIAMERHDGCRKGGKGYPCRAVRTKDLLYIYNFEPLRWPAGSPDLAVCARRIPFGEIDTSPTKTYLMEHRNEHGVARLAQLAFGIRAAEELYNLKNDPDQLHNVAGAIEMEAVQQSLRRQLFDHLKSTKDPRVAGGSVAWDYYPYYGWIHPNTQGWSVEAKP